MLLQMFSRLGFVKSLICAAAALALAGQAHARFRVPPPRGIVAYSIGATNGVDPGFNPYESAVVTFDAANAAGITETIGGTPGAVGLFTGTTVDVAAAPVGDTSEFQAIGIGGSVKFDFTNYAPGIRSLSLYVGSIDAYNTFSIRTNFRTYNFNGANFLQHNGDQSSDQTNRRVYFLLGPTETFKSITLGSNGIAFEYDDIAAAPLSAPFAFGWPPDLPDDADLQDLFPYSTVPEPATWALMLGGFGLIGAGVRRRRNALAI